MDHPGKDAGLTLLVLAAQSAPYVFTRRFDAEGAWAFADYWPVLLTSLPVLFRRWQPTYALLLTAAGIAAYAMVDTGPAQPIWYGPLVCFYAVAYQAPPRQRLVVLVVTAVGMLSIISRSTPRSARWRPGRRRTCWAPWPAPGARPRRAKAPRRRSSPPSGSAPGSPATCTTSSATRSA